MKDKNGAPLHVGDMIAYHHLLSPSGNRASKITGFDPKRITCTVDCDTCVHGYHLLFEREIELVGHAVMVSSEPEEEKIPDTLRMGLPPEEKKSVVPVKKAVNDSLCKICKRGVNSNEKVCWWCGSKL